MFFFRLKKYIEYKRRAVNQYGLHSPFLFDLYNACFKPRFTHPFGNIERIRNALKNSSDRIEISDFGAGSMTNNSNERSISQMYKSASISRRQGELFNRLVNYFKPETVLELGTHLGVSGLYFLDQNKTNLTTIEACENTQNVAKKTLSPLIKRVKVIGGTFREKLPEVLSGIENVELVYIDGNHDFENTIWHFNTLLSKVNENSVFIFDDINWSPEMAKAWNQIILEKQVSISVNCYKFGMVFFRKGIKKQDFYFKF